MYNYTPGTRYRHYKWGHYEIVCEATDEATMNPVIVYRGLWETTETQQIWVREQTIFESMVTTVAEKVPRFTQL